MTINWSLSCENKVSILFLQIAYRLTAVIELTARDKVGKLVATFFQLGFKQPVSLSISSDSAAMLKAMTSKSEKRGTGPGLRIVPFSVTNPLEKSLHISKNLTNFVYKLHITR